MENSINSSLNKIKAHQFHSDKKKTSRFPRLIRENNSNKIRKLPKDSQIDSFMIKEIHNIAKFNKSETSTKISSPSLSGGSPVDLNLYKKTPKENLPSLKLNKENNYEKKSKVSPSLQEVSKKNLTEANFEMEKRGPTTKHIRALMDKTHSRHLINNLTTTVQNLLENKKNLRQTPMNSSTSPTPPIGLLPSSMPLNKTTAFISFANFRDKPQSNNSKNNRSAIDLREIKTQRESFEDPYDCFSKGVSSPLPEEHSHGEKNNLFSLQFQYDGRTQYKTKTDLDIKDSSILRTNTRLNSSPSFSKPIFLSSIPTTRMNPVKITKPSDPARQKGMKKIYTFRTHANDTQLSNKRLEIINKPKTSRNKRESENKDAIRNYEIIHERPKAKNGKFSNDTRSRRLEKNCLNPSKNHFLKSSLTRKETSFKHQSFLNIQKLKKFHNSFSRNIKYKPIQTKEIMKDLKIFQIIVSFLCFDELNQLKCICRLYSTNLFTKTILKQKDQVLWKGIRNDERINLWIKLGNVNKLKRENPNYYSKTIKVRSIYEPEIITDIHRTFPEFKTFKETKEKYDVNIVIYLRKALLNILKAISSHFGNIGYVQGMNFLAALIYMVLRNEEDTFWLLVHLWKHLQFESLYATGFEKLKELCFKLDCLVYIHLPELYKCFSRLDIKADYYGLQWFLTLCTYDFPLNIVTTLIDLFLVKGWVVIFQVLIALLTIFQNNILSLDDDSIMEFLKCFTRESLIDKKKLFEVAHEIKIPDKTLLKLEQKYIRTTEASDGGSLISLSDDEGGSSKNGAFKKQHTKRNLQIIIPGSDYSRQMHRRSFTSECFQSSIENMDEGSVMQIKTLAYTPKKRELGPSIIQKVRNTFKNLFSPRFSQPLIQIQKKN